MTDTRRFSLVKPTTLTPFHIDFDWWKQHDNNWRVYLQSCLCAEHQIIFENLAESACIDWVDPETAEVTSLDGIQHTLITHCALQPDFLTKNTALVEAVFRVLMTHGNTPMTLEEISPLIDKPADVILRTLSGPTVFKGIRPCHT